MPVCAERTSQRVITLRSNLFTTRDVLRVSCLSLAILSLGPACGEDERPPAAHKAIPDAPCDALCRRNCVLDVDITLDEADWSALRHEGRSLAAVYSGCAFQTTFKYTTMPATVAIDGRRFERAGLRKKGFLGSLSTLKPALRIDLSEYETDQSLYGTTVITLNNAISDPSLVRQCLAYDVFAKAGSPAPRCGFANVRVNGADFGTYVHVEPIKKPLLRRDLGDDEGDLYEGQQADFRSDRLRYFEKKTNESAPPSPELEALSRALEAPDDELMPRVEAIIDLDAYLLFWATEALINHWDSYSGNQNNFFVYVHSQTRKLHFIPWGADNVFRPDGDETYGRPQTVYAAANLARRLYALPATRARYRQTLEQLLQDVWDPTALSAAVDAMAHSVGAAANAQDIEQLQSFIAERRAFLEAELTKPDAPWTLADRPGIDCDSARKIPVRGSFRTTWGTPPELASPAPDNMLDVVLRGASPTPRLRLSYASEVEAGQIAFGVVTVGDDGSLVVVQLMTPHRTLAPGALEFHGFETFGVLLTGSRAEDLQIQGYISEGSIELEQVGLDPGDAIIGHFQGAFTYTTRALLE